LGNIKSKFEISGTGVVEAVGVHIGKVLKGLAEEAKNLI
jgi:hypothetical protein